MKNVMLIYRGRTFRQECLVMYEKYKDI